MPKNNLSHKFIEPNELDLLDQFDKTAWGNQRSKLFKIDDDIIFLQGEGSVNIRALKNNISDVTYKGFCDTITALVENNKLALSSILNQIRVTTVLFKQTQASEITIEAITSFYELIRTRKVNYEFLPIKSFLLEWHKNGIEGVGDDVADFLSSINSPRTNKRPSGSKVRSDNPNEGWYTEQEYDGLVTQIWADYERDIIPLYKTLILLLSAQYGRRPIQLAHLKIKDIKIHSENLGVSGKRIEFPGAKEKKVPGFREGKLEIHQ